MRTAERKRYAEALVRIKKKLLARFPLDSKVRMSREGARRFPRYKDRIGVVVGYYAGVSPKILFEGFKTAKSWSPDFLQPTKDR